MHAVHRLYQHRLALSTLPFRARGHKVVRCELCRLAKQHCICSITPKTQSNLGFVVLMYDTEVLKPSNTGKLIADVIPDTYAYLWSRTEPDAELLALLNDDSWQPFVVFPEQFVTDTREVVNDNIEVASDKRPLFIMLDGSWREAKKMFRKSPYLNRFPVVSFDPEKLEQAMVSSRYQLRKAPQDNQLATAEVAARVIAMAGEHQNAQLLDLWFDVFSYQYQRGVCQTNLGDPLSIENYQTFLKQYLKPSVNK